MDPRYSLVFAQYNKLLSRLRHTGHTIANLWKQTRPQIFTNAGLQKQQLFPQMYSHASETEITNNILCLARRKGNRIIGSKSRAPNGQYEFLLVRFLFRPLFCFRAIEWYWLIQFQGIGHLIVVSIILRPTQSHAGYEIKCCNVWTPTDNTSSLLPFTVVKARLDPVDGKTTTSFTRKYAVLPPVTINFQRNFGRRREAEESERERADKVAFRRRRFKPGWKTSAESGGRL